MKVIIADTPPVNYLILVGSVEVLPRLFAHIVIPEAVLAELTDPSAPAAVAAWIAKRPDCIVSFR